MSESMSEARQRIVDACKALSEANDSIILRELCMWHHGDIELKQIEESRNEWIKHDLIIHELMEALLLMEA